MYSGKELEWYDGGIVTVNFLLFLCKKGSGGQRSPPCGNHMLKINSIIPKTMNTVKKLAAFLKNVFNSKTILLNDFTTIAMPLPVYANADTVL